VSVGVLGLIVVRDGNGPEGSETPLPVFPYERHSRRRLTMGRLRSPPPSALLLLLGALDPHRAEAGVFVTNVCLKLLLFVFERLDCIHIGKL
jgi:hypothetical protein